MINSTKDDLKQLASSIEVLSKDIQDKLNNNTDVFPVVNELIRNSLRLVFTLGEFLALEQVALTKKSKNKIKSIGKLPMLLIIIIIDYVIFYQEDL